MKNTILTIVAVVLVVMNVAAYVLMGVDKKRAKAGAWRIPEKTLFLVDKRRAKKDLWRIKEKTLFLPVLLGGGVGGIAGMKVFHHKTKHWYFRFGFPAMLVAQVVLLVAGAIWLL